MLATYVAQFASKYPVVSAIYVNAGFVDEPSGFGNMFALFLLFLFYEVTVYAE